MSRSYRTDPARVIARRRMEGAVASCRIVEREPAHGDIHPLSAKHLRRIIPGIYKRYFYGLTSVELRPREGNEIGRPYGVYLNDERKIWLYSLPFPEWRFAARTSVGLFEAHGAEISREGDETIVRWPRSLDLAFFMYREVFLHELGHHYHNRYRTKYPHPRTPAAKESSADRHARYLIKLRAFDGWYDVEDESRRDSE